MKPASRQRVSVACVACRAKRMRCDGKQPICDPCARRSIECVYQHTENKRRPPSKKYVESLQARIRHLESQLMSIGGPRTFPLIGPDLGALERDESEADSVEDDDDHDPFSELIGLVGRLAVVDDGQLHYFGSQSSLNLPRQQFRPTTMPDPWTEMRSQGLTAAAQLGKLVAAPNELEEHLLDLFWTWQNPWNYIVHKGAFLRSRNSPHGGRYCSPLLLSAIFAISARYSDRVELRTIADDPSTSGNAFCEQAKILLLYESEAPSVTTVQAAAILALRIMSDGKEALGWLYCGNATRMAHNLGLHMECSGWVAAGLISEEEAEVRKVTWWGCFVVDKLFACGLGRPSSIQRSGVTCPKPTLDGDEYIPWVPKGDGLDQINTLGAHSHIVSTAHFVSECMAIACEALEMIYAPNSKFTFQDIEGIVSKADMDLRAYYNALPSHLRLPSSPKIPTLPHIYLSHIQYYTHFALLHRPLIQKKRVRRPSKESFTEGSTLNVDETPYLNQHMEICRYSATQISKLIHIFKQHYTLRQIPIAAVHLTFAAAIIHLIDARPANPNWNQAVHHLETCVDALKDLRTPWCAWADRSLRGVHLLALNWYGCDDVMQLKKYHELREGKTSSSAPELDSEKTLKAPGIYRDDDVVASGSRASGEISMTAFSELHGSTEQFNDAQNPNVADPFAFLFQNTATESDTKDRKSVV